MIYTEALVAFHPIRKAAVYATGSEFLLQKRFVGFVSSVRTRR